MKSKNNNNTIRLEKSLRETFIKKKIEQEFPMLTLNGYDGVAASKYIPDDLKEDILSFMKTKNCYGAIVTVSVQRRSFGPEDSGSDYYNVDIDYKVQMTDDEIKKMNKIKLKKLKDLKRQKEALIKNIDLEIAEAENDLVD